MRRYLRIAALALLAAVAPLNAQDAQQRIEWNRPFAPFNIVGNVHYVGTEGLSSFLITGPRGHILIDGGLPESAPLIAANITTLGFKLRDVKYLLINHTHFDHAGGLAELQRRTGAKIIASGPAKRDLEVGRSIGRPELKGFMSAKVDRIIRDGARLTLGPNTLVAHLTPGHDRGSTSWTMIAAGKTVVFASSITVAGQKLVGNREYPRVVDDFRSTFAKLRAMRADVFLNFHPEFFAITARRARQIAGDANAFVDSGELGRQVDRAEQSFNAELAAEARK